MRSFHRYPAPADPVSRCPAAIRRSRTRPPNSFVYGYLKGRGLTDVLAEMVACEASRALWACPNWHATRNETVAMHIGLFRVLVDAGYKSHSAELTGDLLKEMREHIEIVGSGQPAVDQGCGWEPL